MNELLEAMDQLLVAYERAAPSIDQRLVNRVLTARERAKRHYAIIKRGFLSSTKAWIAGVAHA